MKQDCRPDFNKKLPEPGYVFLDGIIKMYFRGLTRLGHRLSSFSAAWYTVGSFVVLPLFCFAIPYLCYELLLPHLHHTNE